MTASINGDNPVASVRRLMQAVIARPGDVVHLSEGELDLVLRLARRVRLLGWLAAQLQQLGALGSLPDVAVEQLESALVVADARSRFARWELDRIAWALDQHESRPVIVLKGCAYLLRNFPNAAGRTFADVDLLVAKDDLSAVESVLIRYGWRSRELSIYDQNFYRVWSHEVPPLVHSEREVEVDLHHNIRGPYAPFKPDPSLLLHEAQAIAGSGFLSLCDADIVLHMMTHFMFGGDLADGLRDLVDIDVLLRHFDAQQDDYWQHLVARAVELDLTLPAFYSLRYARRLLGTPVPNSISTGLAASAPSGITIWLMDRLVPLALFPQHPDVPSKRVSFARWLLYVRSHWVSLPPLMLVRHLSYKFYVRHLQGRFRSNDSASKRTDR